MENYDFSGWATKVGLRCSDGRTIMKHAFKENDGKKVPLVWGHRHDDPNAVIGYGILEDREEGMRVYGKFNDSKNGQTAKTLVEHGDIESLSIYANQLKENMGYVSHGNIREVSLVLSGANPGAFIDSVIMHGEESDSEAVIYTGEALELMHSDCGSGSKEEPKTEPKEEPKEEPKTEPKEEPKEKTIGDVLDSMTEEQQEVVNAIIGELIDKYENQNGKSKEDNNVKHNVFDTDTEKKENVLSHDAMNTIVGDAKRLGSMKESFLAHAEEYGIENLEFLLPDAKVANGAPEFIKRDQTWVTKFMNGTRHSPFSRIKSRFADITEDEARAKGYIKGKLKKEEVFGLLKRATQPTTIYKKQKMDRDDLIDITDFDVVSWLKSEMRLMLDEEIARACLFGDGRLSSSDDKIDENCIRPIVNDADLFVIRWAVASDASDETVRAKNFIRASVKARKNYKGSGNTTLYTTEDMLTDMLLLEDTQGHRLYKTEAELCAALRCKDIQTVSLMEGLTDKDGKAVYGIYINPTDYTIGADKGGAVNMFDDFDIDYNQQKYLIETRCSASLNKPFSAIVLRAGNNTVSEEPTVAQATAPFKQ